MATGGLYGSSGTGALIAQPGSESSGLYGNSTSFGGTYFEWFIFQTSETQPATPTGGTWNFITNANTPPTGWSSTPPSNPLNTVWVSIAIVNSKNTAALVWSVPGKFAFSSGLPILSGNGVPASGDGQSDQLYIQLDTTPQTIWFKESGTWTRLTGSTLYADLTSNQTIAGTKTFSSQIQGSISGTASNVTGTVAITNGGTGSTTAVSARAALGAAASGANSDITSLSGLTTALSLSQGGTSATTAPDARTNLGLGSAAVLTAGAANGVATLDAGGTVPLSQIPASIQGGVSYQGAWNATTNTPTLTSSVGSKGYYYVVSVAGSTNLNGITSWNIGDWAIYNGTAWEKIDNTDAVTSVNGYTGTVVLTNTDISGFGTMSTQNANAVAITGGTATLTSLTVNDNTTLGSSNSDTTTFNGRIASEFTPSTANTYDLGRNSHEWRNLYLTGTANISALTASGTVTLNGGTANGVAYLNGSKVLTTGSALTFDGSQLYIAGTSTFADLRFASTGYIKGGANVGDLRILTDRFRLYNLAGTQIAYNVDSTGAPTWYIGGSEKMRLTSTGLGIGTSSPTNLVDIRKDDSSPSLVVGRTNGTGTLNEFIQGLSFVNGSNATYNAQIYAYQGTAFPDALGLGFITQSGTGNRSTRMVINHLGNVGIGTSAPANKLDVATGVDGYVARFTGASGAGLIFETGTFAGSSLSAKITHTSGNRNLGFSTPSGTGVLFFETNNTERMRIDSSGNVGIGTSSPTQKVTVTGNMTSTAAGTFYIDGGTPGNASVPTYSFVSDTDTGMWRAQTNTLNFSTGGTERLRIDASGNLGLGVTPSAWSVGKAIQVGNGMNLWDGNGNSSSVQLNCYYNAGHIYQATGFASRYVQTSGQHQWYTAPSGTAGNAISFTQAMTLDASGRLGIGRTNPSYLIDGKVAASASNVNALQISNDLNASIELYVKNDVGTICAGGTGNLVFATGAVTERARIDSSGNLLVGTTSSDPYGISSGAAYKPTKVQVASNVNTDVLGIYKNGFTGTYVSFYYNSSTSGSASAGTNTGNITTNGTSTTYATSSDYRLKEDVQPMTGALAKVAALKPVTYKWKSSGEADQGFIAHELAEVVPGCVTGEKDAVDAEGNPVYQGIDTSFLVATLTAAIQEQQAIIESLKARLDAANL